MQKDHTINFVFSKTSLSKSIQHKGNTSKSVDYVSWPGANLTCCSRWRNPRHTCSVLRADPARSALRRVNLFSALNLPGRARRRRGIWMRDSGSNTRTERRTTLGRGQHSTWAHSTPPPPLCINILQYENERIEFETIRRLTAGLFSASWAAFNVSMKFLQPATRRVLLKTQVSIVCCFADFVDKGVRFNLRRKSRKGRNQDLCWEICAKKEKCGLSPPPIRC